MAKITKSPKRSSGTFTLGRARFSKISAVEGISLSHQALAQFEEFDRQGLTADERRQQLTKKLARKS